MQEMQGIPVQSLGGDDPLEEEMAAHSRTLTWRIPWTEEPGWATWSRKELDTAEATKHLSMHGEGYINQLLTFSFHQHMCSTATFVASWAVHPHTFWPI